MTQVRSKFIDEDSETIVTQLVTGLVQVNLQLQWPQKRINILDVLKPTEEEIAKYYKRNGDTENTNDSFSDNKSPTKFKNDSGRMNDDFDNDKEEMGNALKRNQKPSELEIKSKIIV